MKTINFSSLSKYNQDEPYVNIVKSQTKKRKKSRRLKKSKKSNSINNECRVVSVNAASLKGKILSLENLILDFQPSIFGIQETHYQKMGQIMFQNSDE